jgi:hypothetical protein
MQKYKLNINKPKRIYHKTSKFTEKQMKRIKNSNRNFKKRQLFNQQRRKFNFKIQITNINTINSFEQSKESTIT